MITRYALALSGFAAAAASVAQPTLTSSNVPGPGSEFALFTRDGYQDVGPTGANVSFEYWGMLLPNTGNRPSRWFSASSAPTGALIPSAADRHRWRLRYPVLGGDIERSEAGWFARHR
ncbi:MAG: hypothetical protein IPJ85_17590 [Flavobacteriales bacterium]|nr:hypothetical protein [Flavobacteriales bacterium]